MFFTEKEINLITNILEQKPKISDNSYLWSLVNPISKQSLNLTIYNNIEFGEKLFDSIISVQTQQGYFELHDCTAFFIFEPDEIFFIHSHNNKLSCLIISKECNCSMFSNIDKDLLSSDFSELDTRLLLSAMQLSIIESIL